MNKKSDQAYIRIPFTNTTTLEESRNVRYIDLPKPLYPQRHWLKLDKFGADDKSYLGPDNSVIIPPEICKKVSWKTGSKLWIEVYDEDLSQIIIGKELSGEEAVKGMERLKRIISGQE
jgi:hypothetical protein